MRILRPFLLFVVACLLSMIIAYGTTRLLLQEERFFKSARAVNVEQANDLRMLANEVRQLGEQLQDQLERRTPAERAVWSQNVLLPNLLRFRDRLDAARESLPHPPLSHLEAGWRALDQAARHPDLRDHQEEGVAEAVKAWSAVERYIGQLGAGARIAAPRRRA